MRWPTPSVRTMQIRQLVAFVILVAVSVVVYHVRETDLQQQAAKICAAETRDWNAWQKVIATTRNPPSLQGRPVTARQRAALDTYSDKLREDVGERPDC